MAKYREEIEYRADITEVARKLAELEAAAARNAEGQSDSADKASRAWKGYEATVHSIRPVDVEVDTEEAKAKLKGIEREIDSLSRQRAKILAEADTAGATAQLEALDRRISALSRERVHIQAEADTAGAQANLAGLKSSTDGGAASLTGLFANVTKTVGGLKLLDIAMSQLKWPVMIQGATAAAGALGALSGGAVALAGSLGRVAGIAPGVGVAGLALGQGFGVAKLATMGLKDAFKASADGAEAVAKAQTKVSEATAKYGKDSTQAKAAQEGLTKAQKESAAALDGLDPAAKAFVVTVQSMAPELKKLQQTAQAGLFPGVVAAMVAMRPLFAQLTPVIAATAGAIGDLASRGGTMLASLGPQLTRIGMDNVPIITSLGNAFLKLVPALVTIVQAAQPLALWMARLAETWSGNIAGATAAGAASGKLAAFFERAKESARLWFGMLGNLAVGLFNVFKAAAPLGDWLVSRLGNATRAFRELTGSVEGQNKMAAWFERLKPPLEAFGRLAGDTFKGLGRVMVDMAPQITPLIDKLRTDLLPVVLDLVSKIDGRFIASIIDLTAGFLKFFGALSNTAVLGTFVQLVSRAFDALNAIMGLPGVPEIVTVLMLAGSIKTALAVAGAIWRIKDGLAEISKTKITGGVMDLLGGKLGGKRVATTVAVEGAEEGGRSFLAKLSDFFGRNKPKVQPSVDAPAPAGGKGLLATAGPLAAVTAIGMGYNKMLDGVIGKWADTDKHAIKGMTGVADWVGSNVPIIGGVWKNVINLWAIGLGHAKQVVTTVLGAIPGIVGGIVSSVAGFFASLPGKIVGAVSSLGGMLLGWIGGIAGTVLGAIGGFLGNVVGFFASLPGRAVGAIGGLLGAVVGFFGGVFGAVLGAVGNGIGAVVGFFASLPGRALGAVSSLVGALVGVGGNAIRSMAGAIAGGAGAIFDFFKGIPGRIVGAIGDLAGIGRDIIEGIIRGIRGMAGRLIDAVKAIIPGPIKQFLGISSPAKIAVPWGRALVQGMAVGVRREDGTVTRAMGQLGPFDPAAFGASSLRGYTPAAQATSPGSADVGALAVQVGALATAVASRPPLSVEQTNVGANPDPGAQARALFQEAAWYAPVA